MLLSKEFLEVCGEAKRLKESLRNEVLGLCSLPSSHSSSSRVEVGEVQTADDRTQCRVRADVREELAEDPRVRNGDLSIQSRQCCRVNTP